MGNKGLCGPLVCDGVSVGACFTIEDEGGRQVASVMFGHGIERDEAMARGQLFAVAPALLEALEEAVAHAQPLPGPLGAPLSEHQDVWPEWVVNARALIAEAREQKVQS